MLRYRGNDLEGKMRNLIKRVCLARNDSGMSCVIDEKQYVRFESIFGNAYLAMTTKPGLITCPLQTPHSLGLKSN